MRHYLIIFLQAAFLGVAAKGLPAVESATQVRGTLATPVMTTDAPGPGRRVLQVAPEYEGTDVHHALYLPVDWKPGGKYPVIVEYTGNKFPPCNSTGKVEDANLGYGMSGGRGFIWVAMPYIEIGRKENAVTWWGDKQATVDYCKINLPRICEAFGGDPDNVFICGFSRGAIAASYIGLADDEIASLWKGVFTHDHFDGEKKWKYPDSDRAFALARLARLKGRPVLVCGTNATKVRDQYLKDHLGMARFTFLDVPVSQIFNIPEGKVIHPHTDLWMHKESGYRRQARTWIQRVLQSPANTNRKAAPEELGYADISAEIKDLLDNSKVPSLAAAVIVDGEIRAVGTAGKRKSTSDEPVTLHDKYHLGSCTKSMTATLAAMLVAEGRIGWDTTVADIFKAVKIHPGYQATTLRQLLTNTGGCPKDIDRKLWSSLWKAKGTPTKQRMQLVEGILKDPPKYPPGASSEYSNAGFSIAGAMLEQVTGKPYEELLRKRLFQPLEMDSAGFRAPATNGKVDQPYGHNPKPVDPEPAGDNPRAIAPAGAVHCSILDFAKYARLHLGVDSGGVVTAEQLRLLHTPTSLHNYAMGWIVTERKWAKGKALTHTGSNTMFYSVIWIAPERNFAAVATCNFGGDEGFKTCDQAIAYLIEKYLKKQ